MATTPRYKEQTKINKDQDRKIEIFFNERKIID